MSSEYRISLADLSHIHGSLQGLRTDLGTVYNQVDSVGREVAVTRNDLSHLWQEFRNFVEADARAKELHLAETRQVKIRQELETRFGYYGEVRRLATGILQASDISLVRRDTLTSVTEEIMLAAPAYWLAPALVALGAWLNDNQPLADKALLEALRRDDEKTSLFFALISRRARRAVACHTWLDRYLGQQDPQKLDRQVLIMVDALASGVFGSDIRTACSRRIEAWVEELSQRAGFVEEQRQQWSDALRSRTPTADHSPRYGYLAQYSTTWLALNDMLNGAALHQVIRDYIHAIFEGEIVPAANILAAVDDLLNKLVKHFDGEELPLRRSERLCALIIEEGGNRNTATDRYNLEAKALDEEVSFTQLLTNAAMHPELSQASRATQRYAISLSQQWIKDAHHDLTASLRASVPEKINISIEDWQGQTRQGDNEAELVSSLTRHLDARKEQALARVRMTWVSWMLLAIGILLLVAGLPGFHLLPLVGGAVFVALFWKSSDINRQRRRQIENDFAHLKEQSTQVLKACLAETVELRRDFTQRDAIAPEVIAQLEGRTADQHILSSYDATRQVLA